WRREFLEPAQGIFLTGAGNSSGGQGIYYVVPTRRMLRHAAALPFLAVSNIVERIVDEDSKMKILLVDDHALIRDAVRGVLKELIDDAAVFEASDCRQAMRLIEAHPDLHLILLDLNLPDRDGFAMLADVRKRYATISVVVLSAVHDRESVITALDLGALGFIPKSAPRDVMVNAL